MNEARRALFARLVRPRVAPEAVLISTTACLAHQGVDCRVCGEVCETSAIRFRPRLGGAPLPELDLQACNHCGACAAPCPGQAITVPPVTEAPCASSA